MPANTKMEPTRTASLRSCRRRARLVLNVMPTENKPIGLVLVTPDRSGRSTRRSPLARGTETDHAPSQHRLGSTNCGRGLGASGSGDGALSASRRATSGSGGITASFGRAVTLGDGRERVRRATPDDLASFMRLAPRALQSAAGAGREHAVGGALSAGITSRCTRRHRRRLAPSPLRGGIVSARAAGERPRWADD